VHLRLRFADASTQDVTLPVEIWSQGDRYQAVIAVKAPVVGARLWPEDVVPDWNATNDTWGTPPAATAGSSATTGGLSGEIGGHAVP
jgi:hypothetical protein